MAESGFAPSSETETEAQPAVEAPAAPPVPVTVEEIFTQLEENTRSQLVSSADLTNRLMSASVRKRLVRERLDELTKEKFGEDTVKFLGENKWAYDQLHEKMRSQVEEHLSEGLAQNLDSTMDSYIERAYAPLGEDHESAFSEPKRFVTWIDCLIRELFAVAAPSMTSPHSIVFELLNGADNFTGKGVKMSLNWRGADAGLSNGVVRSNNMIIHNFPWVGREALVLPEDADTEKKDFIKGRRRIYAMAVLLLLSSTLTPNS